MIGIICRSQRSRAQRRKLASSDGGFVLAEVMVAIVVFAILAAAVLGSVIVSSNLTRSDRTRVAAAHLADRELEIAKHAFAQDYTQVVACPTCSSMTNPDPVPTSLSAGSDSIVNGTAFTVVRSVQVLPQGNTGQSACSGGGNVTFPEYLVDVTVSWKHSNGARPVEASTVLTPDKTVVANNVGYLGVSVVDSTGAPVQGLTVTLTGPGPTVIGTTAQDGCYVATLTTAGTWTAALSGSSKVDFYGNPAPAGGFKSQVVTIGSFSNIPLTWADAATITATATQPAGYAAPTSPFGLSVANSGITLPPNGVREYPAANQATNLWPFSDGYAVWAGACTDSDPGSAANGGSRSSNVLTPPAGKPSTTVPLAGVDLTVMQSVNPLVGAQVQLVHQADPSPNGCASGQTLAYSSVTTDATGHVALAAPLGTWQVQVIGQTPLGGTWPTITLTADAFSTPANGGTVTVN
jgi:prepilin-type N-terminal cleavage/methylation domain-containing protein